QVRASAWAGSASTATATSTEASTSVFIGGASRSVAGLPDGAVGRPPDHREAALLDEHGAGRPGGRAGLLLRRRRLRRRLPALRADRGVGVLPLAHGALWRGMVDDTPVRASCCEGGGFTSERLFGERVS